MVKVLCVVFAAIFCLSCVMGSRYLGDRRDFRRRPSVASASASSSASASVHSRGRDFGGIGEYCPYSECYDRYDDSCTCDYEGGCYYCTSTYRVRPFRRHGLRSSLRRGRRFRGLSRFQRFPSSFRRGNRFQRLRNRELW